MTSQTHSPADPPRARWLALDVLRAGAVLLMIQGHTFTALLQPALYRGDWVQVYSLLHGLTAPMFLIGGGLAYGWVTFGAAPAAHESAGNEASWPMHRRRLRRAALLIAIGVGLQLPAAPFEEILARPDMRANVLRAGALQLVGACLLVCETLWLVTRERRRFAWTLGALTLGAVFSAPFVWNARLSDRYALGTWLDGYAGSLFPLVPWCAFFFFGVLARFANDAFSARFGRVASDDPASWKRFATWLGAGGFGLATLGYFSYIHGVQLQTLYGEHNFWHTNPLFVGFRAGLVFAWLGCLAGAEHWIARAFEALPWLARAFRLLAQRSLAAYVVHLLLLYGTPFTAGLIKHGAIYDFAETSGLLAQVLAITAVVVWLWDRYAPLFDRRRRARGEAAWRAASDRLGS